MLKKNNFFKSGHTTFFCLCYNKNMKYLINKNKILVKCSEFDPKSIFECGQTFSYKKFDDVYITYPANFLAAVYKEKGNYVIECLIGETKYFINYFDLDNDYKKIIEHIKEINIKQNYFNKDFIFNALEFGKGIRILKQEKIETIISFIFSANNNIKRFTKSLNLLRENFGEEMIVDCNKISKKIRNLMLNEKFYSFPTLNTLESLDIHYFLKIGAGYRGQYLFRTINKLRLFLCKDFNLITTDDLLHMLLKLDGVGIKVAQCILLFAFNRKDVFPVDTWIKKVYQDMNEGKLIKTPAEISKYLVSIFKDFSGYTQQYLFYFKRESVV